MLRLWFLERTGDWEETSGLVICEATERLAREMAAFHGCSVKEKADWLDTKRSKCTRIGTARLGLGGPRIIMMDVAGRNDG